MRGLDWRCQNVHIHLKQNCLTFPKQTKQATQLKLLSSEWLNNLNLQEYLLHSNVIVMDLSIVFNTVNQQI